MRVEITLERLKIALMRVEITLERVKITLMRVEVTLLRVEIALMRVETTTHVVVMFFVSSFFLRLRFGFRSLGSLQKRWLPISDFRIFPTAK
jgi:hypothetical protein